MDGLPGDDDCWLAGWLMVCGVDRWFGFCVFSCVPIIHSRRRVGRLPFRATTPPHSYFLLVCSAMHTNAISNNHKFSCYLFCCVLLMVAGWLAVLFSLARPVPHVQRPSIPPFINRPVPVLSQWPVAAFVSPKSRIPPLLLRTWINSKQSPRWWWWTKSI